MKDSNGTTRSETQFSVFLANKPGTLAQVCRQLADEKINILALSMMDASEHGVLRLIVEQPERARLSLAALNVPMAESTVLITPMPNRPGALADVVQRLAGNHINVTCAYCTAGAPGGKTLGVFRVSDIRKATRVLAERKPRRKEAPVLRGTMPVRRK